jgi:hypothetical protein
MVGARPSFMAPSPDPIVSELLSTGRYEPNNRTHQHTPLQSPWFFKTGVLNHSIGMVGGMP